MDGRYRGREPVSPCITCRGLWLGLPLERVVSLADGWMGVGTWGWCSVQRNIPQHERHEDVSRNQCGSTSDAVASSHSQGQLVATVEEVDAAIWSISCLGA